MTESTWTVLELMNYVNRESRRRGLYDAKHDISRKFVTSAIQSVTADAEYDRIGFCSIGADTGFAVGAGRGPDAGICRGPAA